MKEDFGVEKKRIGLITFAITLISLGVLLLMRNFLNINLKTIISIAWPCIIILFGIEFIITKIILSKKQEDIRAYVDPLSTILLSIIIVIASIYSSFSFNDRFGFSTIIKSFDLGDISRVVSNYKDESIYNYSYSIDSKNKEELQIINSFGNVEITEGLGENIEITAEIRIRYNDEAYAEELSKSIVKIDETRSVINVLSDIDSSKYDRDRAGDIGVSYNIRVPRPIKVNVDNKFGNTAVKSNKKDVEINNQHGNIEVVDITGAAKLKNSFGNTTVKNISADVEVDSEHGNIVVKNVKGDLFAYNQFGNIDVDNANKFTKIISKNGNISYKTDELIEKGVEIENEFGNIDISVPSNQKGSFNIKAEFGEIKNKLGLNVTEGITEQSINDLIGNSNIKFYIRSRNGNVNLYTN